MSLQTPPQLAGAVEMNFRSAARPQEKLHQALQINEIAPGGRRTRPGDDCIKPRNAAVGSLQGNADWNGIGRGSSTKCPIGEHRRTKLRIQNRYDGRTDQE